MRVVLDHHQTVLIHQSASSNRLTPVSVINMSQVRTCWFCKEAHSFAECRSQGIPAIAKFLFELYGQVVRQGLSQEDTEKRFVVIANDRFKLSDLKAVCVKCHTLPVRVAKKADLAATMWHFCKNNYEYVSSCRSSELAEGQVWRTIVGFSSLPTDHVAPPTHERMLYERRITNISSTMVERRFGPSPNVTDVRLSALVASNRSDFNRTQIFVVQSLLHVHKTTTEMLDTGIDHISSTTEMLDTSIDIYSMRTLIQTAIDHVCACSEEIPFGRRFDILLVEIISKIGISGARWHGVLDGIRVGGTAPPDYFLKFEYNLQRMNDLMRFIMEYTADHIRVNNYPIMVEMWASVETVIRDVEDINMLLRDPRRRLGPRARPLTHKFNIALKVCDEDTTPDHCGEECPVCYDNTSKDTIVTLNCGHQYCGSCVKGILTATLEKNTKFNRRELPPCAMCRVDMTAIDVNSRKVYESFAKMVV